MGDVVIPNVPAEARVALDPDYDHPSRVDELMKLLRGGQLVPSVTWQRADLAVLRAEPESWKADAE
jgi:hypothetical protein